MRNNIFDAIQVITQQVEPVLETKPFEPEQLAKLLTMLDPLLIQLIDSAKTDNTSHEFLAELNLWFEHLHERILAERYLLATGLKELNIGRKASHNYDMNR